MWVGVYVGGCVCGYVCVHVQLCIQLFMYVNIIKNSQLKKFLFINIYSHVVNR